MLPMKKSPAGIGRVDSAVSVLANSSTVAEGASCVPWLHTVTCATNGPLAEAGAAMAVTTRSGPKPKPTTPENVVLLDSMSSMTLLLPK